MIKKYKYGPHFLIGGLLIILVFILGVRYGQRVELANKTIQHYLTITAKPSPSPLPSPLPSERPVKFINYNHQHCGLKFLYPDSLTIWRESSTSAEFRQKKTDRAAIVINCNQAFPNSNNSNELKSSTEKLKFKDKNITAVKESINAINFYTFSLKNPRNRLNIKIKISEYLYPLFEKTFEFSS